MTEMITYLANGFNKTLNNFFLKPAQKSDTFDEIKTHRIERNNCQMRHSFGRSKRKSIIVSKSLEMVDLTIALFAKFRVNGNVFDIVNLGGGQFPNIIS